MRTVLALFIFIGATIATAADVPQPDATFGTGGLAAIGFDFGNGGDNRDTARAFALSTNGRVVIGGTYATGPRFIVDKLAFLPGDLGIVRLLGDGTPDHDFGLNGRAMLNVVPPNTSTADFGDLVSLSDGRILYAGSYVTPTTDSNYFSALIIGRLHVDGSPDTSFQLDRVFTPGAFLPAAKVIYVRRMKVQADGKIVILVTADLPNPFAVCAGIMRLLPDGATDTSFGHGSGVACVAPTTIVAPYAYAYDFVPLSSGGIVLGGPVLHTGGNGQDFGIARLSPDGTLDASFGVDSGWAYVAFDRGAAFIDYPVSMAVDAQGRILAAGIAQTDTGTELAITRLSSNGLIDTSFGVNGRVEMPSIGGAVIDFQLLANNHLLLSTSDTNGNVQLTMLKPNGALDSDFASSGNFAQTDINDCLAAGPTPNGVLLTGDALYLTGCHNNAVDNPDHSTNLDFGVARYQYTGPIFKSGFDGDE